jgi:capsular exopolysaccharide synthesis family protein
MLPNPEVREVTLEDYITIIRKRAKVAMSILVIVPLTVTVIVFAMRPVYRATTSLLIERTPPKITKFEEVYQAPAATSYSDMQYYQTQYKILASRTLAERVFEQLHLGKDKDFQNVKDPVEELTERIKVEPVRNSQMVLLHVDDTDALRASAIANTLAKFYMQQDIETRNIASKEAVGWLESQLADVKKKMQESQEALGRYVQKHKIVSAPMIADTEKKIKTLLEVLKEDRSRKETELAEALKRYKEKHPKIIALRAQIDNIDKKIEKETDALLDLNQKMVQYNLLKQEAESNQQLYQSILARAKETDVSEKIEASRIRIIDSAKIPDKPIRPKKVRDIILSIFFGIFCAIGAALFLEYLDSTIHTAEDVRLYINLPFLGYVSKADASAKTDVEKDLICYKKPDSITSETYRVIRTSILFASPEDEPLKTILVTSSIPQEGKTFMSSNLATIFSQASERVVLVDIDMRRPRMHKSYNLELKNGLSDFLAGKADLEEVIKTTFIENLSMITAGTIPPNPSELLQSGKVRLLFEELKSRFDRIILDSSPILSVADSLILANVVDGVILVIKGASTQLDGVRRAKEKIIAAKGRIVGVIINNIEAEKEDRYYYYHYYGKEEAQKQK